MDKEIVEMMAIRNNVDKQLCIDALKILKAYDMVKSAEIVEIRSRIDSNSIEVKNGLSH